MLFLDNVLPENVAVQMRSRRDDRCGSAGGFGGGGEGVQRAAYAMVNNVEIVLLNRLTKQQDAGAERLPRVALRPTSFGSGGS